MKAIFLVLAILMSLPAFSQETKHQVIFGNNFGAGWSGSASSADVDSKLGIDELNMTNGEFNINYAYTIAPKFQIGIDFSNEMDTSETEYKAGGKVKSEERNTSLIAFFIFNFNEDLKDSFYAGAGYGKGWNRSEDKDTTGGTTSKTKTEYDGDIFHLMFGKRFNLKGLGIENLTYSPSISYQHVKIGGDLEDAGVNSISGLTLDIVKFDLLF